MTKIIDFNIRKNERKKLVEAIAEFVCLDPEYCGAPSFAYKIGAMTVDKDGHLIVPFIEDEELEIIGILKFLTNRGFVAAYITEDFEDEPDEPTGLTINIPFDKVNCGNLLKLLEAKGSLIKKALGVNDVRIEMNEDNVGFPWFDELLSADETRAYTDFICKLCEMSKKATRVTAKKKETENEKYDFRCFLLRLGFIGEEYKQERKILLKNLSGSSAFKNGGAADVSE